MESEPQIISRPAAEAVVCESLHDFKWLTSQQMVDLGISSPRSLRDLLPKMCRATKPLIGRISLRFHPAKGTLPHYYFLTKHGAAYVAGLLKIPMKEVHYPRGAVSLSTDFYHRRNTVDLHIALHKWATATDSSVEFFHTYFDKQGANHSNNQEDLLRSLTRVKLGNDFFIPDGIFKVRTADGKDHLFVLEVYNGRNTKRVIQQLSKHVQALEDGAFNRAYNFSSYYTVLVVFDEMNALRNVYKRLKTDSFFSDVGGYFAFATLDRIKDSLPDRWVFLNEPTKYQSIF